VNRSTTARIDRELLDEAFRAYLAAGAVTVPLRIELWESRDLTLGQLRLMLLIDYASGLPLGELAQQMRVSPATITGITDRLVRRGFIERQSHPSDRRIVRVVLTQEGAEAVHDISRTGNRLLARVFRQMGERELRTYITALTAFAEAAAAVVAGE